MTTVHDHLKRFPNARPSTLVLIQSKNETTEQLQRENMHEVLRRQAARTPKPWWDRVFRVPSWWRQ